jgi:hypothetical protein
MLAAQRPAAVVAGVLLLLAGCASGPAASTGSLNYAVADDADRARLDPLLVEGMQAVSDTLGLPWQQPLTVAIVPDRAAFTASFPPEYGLTETECWMVAWAVADRLTVLSPSDWRAEACEHDPDDTEHLTLLLRHELVHALHGQHNPTRDFTGMDAMGWFVEGLATYASGQLELEHAEDARHAVAEGKAPQALADAWSGRYRYGVSGSLVLYLDQRCGRDALRRMMAATTQGELLAIAGLDEDELLRAWAEWAGR